MSAIRRLGLTSLLAFSLLGWSHLGAQSRPAAPARTPTEPGLYNELRWRSIGPFRGGRTKAAVGVASQPNVFYIGAVNGGVWKTTDYGRTWVPIFDDQADRLDRGHRRSAVQRRHHLRRQRRRHAAPGPLDGRRHVPIDRRGPDVDAPRAARRAADRADRRRSARSPAVVRRRARSPVRPQRRARALSIHRRRRYVPVRALQGRDTPAQPMCASIRTTRRSSTRCCGSRSRGRGRTPPGRVRAAACSSRPTAAPRGAS